MVRINCYKTRSLYLDERFGFRKNSNGRKEEHYYFVGGIEILDDEKKELINFVRSFKTELIDKIKVENGIQEDNYIDNWELKAKENPSFIKTESGQALRFAQLKWKLWSKKLDKINLNYKFYGTFVEEDSYRKDKREYNKKDMMSIAIQDVISKFYAMSCVKKFPKDRLLDEKYEYEFYPSLVVFDNVDNEQEEALEDAKNRLEEKFGYLKTYFGIGRNLSQVKNINFDEEDELLMQFVDMQIFALTRFIVPQNDNILVNLERFQKMQATKIFPEDKMEIVEADKDFSSMSLIYHHLRFKMKRFGWNPNMEQETSLGLIGDKRYTDFELEFHGTTADFFNIFKEPNGKGFKLLRDSYKRYL